MQDERMTISERYMTARTTSSLRMQARTRMSPADVIAAAGMAGHKHDLALMLFNLQHRPTITRMHQLADILALRLESYMLLKKHKGRPRIITKQVLAWWIGGTCKHCDGTGYERIPGTPHLSDIPCPTCSGSGKTQLQTENNESAQWLLSEINALAHSAETAIRSRIN